MWPARLPAASAWDVVQACVRGTKNTDLRNRLSAAAGQLEKNSRQLQDTAQRHELYAVTSSSFGVQGVSDDEMKSTYTRQLGRAGRPASVFRNQLMSSAAYRLCCYCQYGQATTLDHFVPKDFAPALAIDPWNLVPACSRCNHKLSNSFASTPANQMLHPYAMPSIGRWLYAEVEVGQPVSIHFFTDPDASLDEQLRERVMNEFLSLDLNLLYSVVSGVDISQTNSTLSRLFPEGDIVLVRSHLQEAAADCFRMDVNSRRGVIFEALSKSDWYCNEGYRDVAAKMTWP